jgi:hypothetical protein
MQTAGRTGACSPRRVGKGLLITSGASVRVASSAAPRPACEVQLRGGACPAQRLVCACLGPSTRSPAGVTSNREGSGAGLCRATRARRHHGVTNCVRSSDARRCSTPGPVRFHIRAPALSSTHGIRACLARALSLLRSYLWRVTPHSLLASASAVNGTGGM